MKSLKLCACSLGVLVIALTLPCAAQSVSTSQSSSSSSQGTTQGTTGPAARRNGRGDPCFRQIGVSQSVIQQGRQIEQNTRSQIQSVCSDTSLSAQQKQEKVRDLRQQARKQIEGLFTPDQQQQLKACREQRRGNREQAGNGQNGQGGRRQARRAGGEGPCGQLASGDNTEEPEQDQPDDNR